MTSPDNSLGPLFLGIDTGGTYTDAVLWSEALGVVAKAKALTTRHDLAEGISGAVDAVLGKAGVAPTTIGLVSMSTTLATNALVEGQGGRVALVMIGFKPEDLGRDGLVQALGGDPVVFCPGGHDVHGNATALDRLSAMRRPVCRACLDWSVRREHLAGSLGAAILERILAEKWARREDGSRAVRFTPPGKVAFERAFLAGR